jgi:hypothetical protein
MTRWLSYLTNAFPLWVPCAISATFHSVLGSILAGLWRLRPPRAVSAPTNDVEVKVGPTSLPTDAVRRK